MQFRVFSAFLVFIGSYLPLAIILAVQDIPVNWWARSLCNVKDITTCTFNPFSNPWLSVSFVAITSLSVLLSVMVFRRISYPFNIEVKAFKEVPNDIINYVFPYVVSFMGISYDVPNKLIGFLVFLSWMFAITYKSGQVLMNPLLLILGWKVYELEILINNERRVVKALSKGSVQLSNYSAQKVQGFYIIRSCGDE